MSQIDAVGISLQTAFGTPDPTPAYYIDVETTEFDGKPELLEVPSTIGYTYPQPLEPGKQAMKLNMKLVPRVASLPVLLAPFFGSPTTTTVDTSAKKHSFDPVAAAGNQPYLSVLLSRNDPTDKIVDLVSDLHGSKLTLSAKQGEFVNLNAEYVGAALDDTLSPPTPTLDATERFQWHKIKLYAKIGTGTEAEAKVESLEWTYDTQLETDHYVLGQRTPASIPVGTSHQSELKFVLVEEDATEFETWYRLALANSSPLTVVTFRILCEGSLIGATTQKAGFEIKLPNCQITDAPAQIDATKRLRDIEVTARANFNTATSKFVTVDVFNTVASY